MIRASADRSQNSSQNERFLYLYLSLMISVFSIITVFNLQVSHGGDPYLTQEAVAPLSEGSHTLFGDPQEQITTHPLKLFLSDSTALDEGGFESLLFLLRSHDLNAKLQISADPLKPELGFAKALTVQHRLEEVGFSPIDVRVEVDFGYSGGSDEARLTLYPYE